MVDVARSSRLDYTLLLGESRVTPATLQGYVLPAASTEACAVLNALLVNLLQIEGT